MLCCEPNEIGAQHTMRVYYRGVFEIKNKFRIIADRYTDDGWGKFFSGGKREEITCVVIDVVCRICAGNQGSRQASPQADRNYPTAGFSGRLGVFRPRPQR